MTDMTPTPSERVVRLVHELQLDPNQFFLGGSAALALRDLRHISDLDVGVTTHYWWKLYHGGGWEVYTPDPNNDWEACDPPYLTRTVRDTEVHVFHSWRWRGSHESPFNDYNLVFREGLEILLGIPVIKLPILLRQKIDAVVNGMYGSLREKDVADTRIISEYLENL